MKRLELVDVGFFEHPSPEDFPSLRAPRVDSGRLVGSVGLSPHAISRLRLSTETSFLTITLRFKIETQQAWEDHFAVFPGGDPQVHVNLDGGQRSILKLLDTCP